MTCACSSIVASSSIRLTQALSSASLILAVLYFWFPALIIGRGVFLIAAFLVIGLVSGWRWLFEWVSGQLAPRERLLLVGTTAPAVALARELFERRHELGVEIVGFVEPDPARGRSTGHQSWRDRYHRGHSLHRPRPKRRSRGRQPCRCPRPAADGQAARDEARRRHVRSSGVGLRVVHRQDRGREPASELADFFVRVQEIRRALDREATAGSGRRRVRPCSSPRR